MACVYGQNTQALEPWREGSRACVHLIKNEESSHWGIYSRQIRRYVLVQRDPKRSTIRQKGNLKVVRDGKMGSGKHTNMDITLGFKGPSLGQNTRDFQIRDGGFQWIWAGCEWEVRPGWVPCGCKGEMKPRDGKARGWESWVLGPRARAGKLFSPCRNCPTHSTATKTFLIKVLKTKSASCEWFPLRAKMRGLPLSAIQWMNPATRLSRTPCAPFHLVFFFFNVL